MTDTMPPADRATTPAETPDIVTGNHHDKYESPNPAIRFLTRRFLGRLDGCPLTRSQRQDHRSRLRSRV